MNRSLTIVIPAFNEEQRVEKVIIEVIESAERYLESYEIVVINDGSSDKTGEIADQIANSFNTNLKVIHIQSNRGVGNAFQIGLSMSCYHSITLIPGDNAFNKTGIESVFKRVGEADLIVTYRENFSERTFIRRKLSLIATFLVRMLSGKAIRDAHSLFVYPVSATRKIQFSLGYGYHMETLVRNLRKAEKFIELPVQLNPKPDVSSGVMKFRTLISLLATVCSLFLLKFSGRL